MEIKEIHLDTIDSTNSYAKKQGATFDRDAITCISAEEQTGGRGRFERKWVSHRGVNLYVTFFFVLPRETSDLPCLAHLMAISMANVLLQEKFHPNIKWPNDLLLNGKKVSGVLCETSLEKGMFEVSLGIGLNVNMSQSLLAEVDQPATSLRLETGHPWDKQLLLKKLQQEFAQNLQTFLKLGFSPFSKQINELLAYQGKRVRVVEVEKEWVGICHSITPEGKLCLLLDEGKFYEFSSGRVKPLGK